MVGISNALSFSMGVRQINEEYINFIERSKNTF